ncbi:TonB-dependent receptor [Aquincola sp. S2]|uniref:TonB-dependent receptor n=1 Tax=Pseudaquabacterium terrae TaxID=2732868 RepID=A0ABX2ESD1_9BURK|nr:TonB-dependent receptor [Aquabacterium terrae]NRF71657.1 TonB-dependent receptor [Aquabacterium terrae]
MRWPVCLCLVLAPSMALATMVAAQVQTPPPLRAAATAAPAASAASTPAASAASAPAAGQQRVEVIGGRSTDTEQRRQSTAAKIVIGREEIDKFGDATVGEVLRRLPGVTTPGAPGRGGPPQLRGLGSGFTQLLIDGQRLPPGFSLDSLTPEQIERIEILRAPTAETGAQAIAGTINIITREGFRKRLNDWRIGTGVSNGEPSLGSAWSHNDSAGDLTYTLSAGLFANRRRGESFSETQVTNIATGELLEDRGSRSHDAGANRGLNLGARLQWRLGGDGDSLVVSPGLFANQGEHRYRFEIDQRHKRAGPEHAESGHGYGDYRFFGPRLQLQVRQRLADWRVEVGGTLRSSRSRHANARQEFRADHSELRSQQDRSSSREKGLQLNAKGSRMLGGDGSEHNLVLGMEAEGARRNDTRTTLIGGVPDPALADAGEDFAASTLRVAAYAQDEWAPDKHWSFHAGLRWEGIATRGDDGRGQRPQSRNSVMTPLVHLLWKPDPSVRDQVRLSLTRSWRAPGTGSLIGRPSINRLYDPATGSNGESSPDNAGNPSLEPELATGIDLAFERYLQGGGLLSANLFHRRIKDLMRSTVELENTVHWSPFPRYVRRSRNIGSATAQGIELESKFRLDQLIAGSAPVEMRANLALLRSRVDSVPGPDNRLDQQSKATGNLGADYRLRGIPLTLGGNLNWVPSTLTRWAADETTRATAKRQWDMFALWTFSPAAGLRLMAHNLLPRDHANESFSDFDPDGRGPLAAERTRHISGGPSHVNLQLRLELKL